MQRLAKLLGTTISTLVMVSRALLSRVSRTALWMPGSRAPSGPMLISTSTWTSWTWKPSTSSSLLLPSRSSLYGLLSTTLTPLLFTRVLLMSLLLPSTSVMSSTLVRLAFLTTWTPSFPRFHFLMLPSVAQPLTSQLLQETPPLTLAVSMDGTGMLMPITPGLQSPTSALTSSNGSLMRARLI